MKLNKFFTENNRVALAFSGGVDSSYLLYEALRHGCDVRAYFVKTVFQPQFELDDALRMAEHLNADIKIIEADVLSDPTVVSNPADRCYYCKKLIFSRIASEAENDGYDVILDGTNASDDEGDRPGIRALRELSVRSPLKECGLTKSEIRNLSREAGLFTWDKPAYACLATRIPTGTGITADKLERTEKAETFLASLGFSNFRVRMVGDSAKIQLLESQIDMLLKNRITILNELLKYYDTVTLDLAVRT
ncbi:MAG: ATP-dependent sacrificial sulfur transferase LarE [Christensenellaceae bacterium]|nr:ATP-dependent sacrificial sulfur transferase LarE [Christensenellaceae bacterium]